MYIDENCFLPFKMEELYTIAVSFGKIVHNRGFTQTKQPIKFSLQGQKGERICAFVSLHVRAEVTHTRARRRR